MDTELEIREEHRQLISSAEEKKESESTKENRDSNEVEKINQPSFLGAKNRVILDVDNPSITSVNLGLGVQTSEEEAELSD